METRLLEPLNGNTTAGTIEGTMLYISTNLHFDSFHFHKPSIQREHVFAIIASD